MKKAVATLLASSLVSVAGVAFGQELRDPAQFDSLADTLLENCIVIAGNQVAPLRNDGSFQVNGVPASRGPIRALVQCAYPEGNFGRWTEAVEPVVNGTLRVPTLVGALGELPPLPVRLSATPATVDLIVGQSLALQVRSIGPTGESTDVSADAVFRTGNAGVVRVGAGGMLTATGVGTAMIGVVFAGRVTVVQATVSQNPDRDGDGIPNIWEEERALDADLADDAGADPDGDGLNTRREYELGTEHDRADTDGDGLLDGAEVLLGTHPLRFDSDGDDLRDAVDNCPLLENVDQADANGDGRGDACPGPCGSAADCDDGDVCTSDVCGSDGRCIRNPVAGCCAVDADCDDGDACTADACRSDGTCARPPITGCCNGDSTCNDGSACTRDQCDLTTHACAITPIAGCCTSDTDCADADACTADVCDEATGVCSRTDVPSCCTSDGDCADADSCTTDTCVGGACGHAAITGCCVDAAACDDGDFCNGAEVCGGVRGCLAGVAPCTDGIGCTVDACVESNDTCTFTIDSALCSDGLFCNGIETCVALTGCQPGEATVCDDGIACTADRCVEGSGCDQTPNAAICNNGSDCDGVEVCDVNLGCIAGTTPSACDDPILEYHFDESLGPTAIDSSGLGRHGSLVNGPAWGSGISASALDFDGINDALRPSSLLTAPPEWTISAFVFDTGGSGRGRGIVHFETDFDPIRFGVDPDRRLSIHGACPAAGTARVPENQWTHVAVTFDGARASYYLNGVLSGTVVCAPFTWSAFGVAGTNASDALTSFRGKIDELEVYSRALPAAQLAERATALSLRFDEGMGSAAIDSGALEYHGVITGATWTPNGFSGSALDFDGVGGIVTVPAYGNVDFGEGLAIEARVRRVRGGVKETIVALARPGEPGAFELYFDENASLVFAVGGVGRVVTSDELIDDGDWHKVEVHARGGTYRLFVDGLADATETAQVPLLPALSSAALTIGAPADLSTPFAGTIDDVRVKPSVAFVSPVGFAFAFDEPSGTTAYDRSSNARHATLLGTAAYAPGLSNSAVRFAGGPGQVSVPFSGPAPAEWTLSAFIFDERAEGVVRSIAGVYAQDPNRSLWLSAGNLLHFNPCATGSEPVPPHRWVHVAVTYSAGTLRYYLDGRLDRAVACGPQPINMFTVGSSGASLTYPFQGSIDQLEFKSFAATAQEIADASKVVSLHFDAVRRTRAEDSSGFQNHARVSNAAWVAGLPGSALSFASPDAVVTIPDASSLALTDGMSIELLLRRSLTSLGTPETLVAKSDGRTPGGWRFYVDTHDRLAFEVSGLGDVAVGRRLLRDGLWHRIALTRAGETFRIVIDGREDARVSAITTPVATNLPLTIGVDSAGRDPLRGTLDEVSIAPSSVERPLMVRYRFDEPSGSSAVDGSGNHFTATLAGVGHVVDRTGSAIDFPNAGVVTSRYPSIFGAPPRWTFEGWIYDRAGPGAIRTIWGVYNADNNRALWLTAQNQLHFNPCAAGAAVLPSNRWVHVALTYDGGTLRYYVDGELDRAVACGPQPIDTFRLGRASTAIYQFDGMMDEVSFYREARTASQVRARASFLNLDFDEAIGDDARDTSGLLNHASLSSGVSWSTGPSGSAVDFDGATGVISVPDSIPLDLESGWSMRLWARRNVLGVDQTLVAKSDGVTPGSWRLHVDESNRTAFEILPRGDVVVSSVAMNDQQWHLIEIVLEGEMYFIHVDGVETAQRASYDVPNAPAVPITLGADQQLGWPLDGAIDDLQIVPFDRPSSSLIARFRMNEGSGTTAEDSSGNRHHGSIDSATWSVGQFGSTLDFAAGAQVVADYPSSRPTPSAWTFEAWIYDRTGPDPNLLRTLWNVYSSDANRSLWLNGQNVLHFNPCAAGIGNVPHDQWAHVALTYDGGTLSYYINGVLDRAVGCGPQPINTFLLAEGIGNTRPFIGQMDEVSFWEEARTPEQIREDASLAILHLDELARTEVVDASGRLNHGQISGAASWSAGFSGGGVDLDGTTGAITLGGSDSLQLFDQFTIELLLLRGSRRGAESVLAAQSGGATGGGWRFYLAANETLRFAIDGVGDVLASSRPLNDNLWRQVVLTKRGETYTLWIDGVRDTVAQSVDSPAPLFAPVTLGARGDGTQVFDGVLDEVRIAPIADPAPTLELRLRFDEGGGPTAQDTSGNSFDGTLLGTARFAAGRVGTALALDGSAGGGVVTTYPGTAYPAPDTWTLEAWINNTNPNVLRTIFNVYPSDPNRALWLTATNRLHFNPCAAGDGPVPTNQWAHVALTYDGGTLRYYINGVLDREVACGPQPIGAIRVGTGINGAYPFAGLIDEVFFFSELRTAQDLARDMTVP